MKTKSYFIIVLFLFGLSQLYAQADFDSTEIKAEIPALNEFHNVIYPIWHVAYPSKDYAALRDYVNDIDSGSQKIYDAQLPGILRDKQEMWEKGVNEFKVAVEEYKRIAAGNDDEMLLKAAENLHSKYESLVRIVHPVIPELDQFHQLLYLIYHKYLPQKNYQKIYTDSDELVSRADALTKVELNTKNAELKKRFNSYAVKLLHACEKLREQLKSNNYEMVTFGVDDVHNFYQKLEALFE